MGHAALIHANRLLGCPVLLQHGWEDNETALATTGSVGLYLPLPLPFVTNFWPRAARLSAPNPATTQLRDRRWTGLSFALRHTAEDTAPTTRWFYVDFSQERPPQRAQQSARRNQTPFQEIPGSQAWSSQTSPLAEGGSGAHRSALPSAAALGPEAVRGRPGPSSGCSNGTASSSPTYTLPTDTPNPFPRRRSTKGNELPFPRDSAAFPAVPRSKRHPCGLGSAPRRLPIAPLSG